jgi:hypothetical protein
MKKSTRICFAIAIIMVTIIPLAPKFVFAWKQSTSSNYGQPRVTSHQWLAQEVLSLYSSPSQMLWITQNTLDFLRGVEAPFNADIAENYVTNHTERYGDINGLVLHLDAAGTTVENDTLAVRAQQEYNNLTAILADTNPDLQLAAFHAGALIHYVTQAGVWGAIWNEVHLGTLNATEWAIYENKIENTVQGDYFSPVSTWTSNRFDITALTNTTLASPKDAQTAVEDLAQAVYNDAVYIGNNFNASKATVDDWEFEIFDRTEACLNRSVEAAYAVLSGAMQDVNWKYLSIADPTFNYINQTNDFEIPAFSVNYTDNAGTFVLDDLTATEAEFELLSVDEDTLGNPEYTYSGIVDFLEYNDTNDKWYYPNQLLYNLSEFTEYTVIYRFNLDGGISTESNITSATFSVNFYQATGQRPLISYDRNLRLLNVSGVQLNLTAIPEIYTLEPDEVNYAKWVLYTKGEGVQGGEEIGVEAYDTEGTKMEGPLTYNATNGTWYSYNNDIGWVHTNVLQKYYILCQFEVTGIPAGRLREDTSGTQTYTPYVQSPKSSEFITRDHEIIMSQPDIVVDLEKNVISVYNITGYTDYQNIELDYYELYEKPIWNQLVRIRSPARAKIFLYDNIASNIRVNLNWDPFTRTWYYENIDISSLPDNTYYVRPRLINYNVNATRETYGPASETFTISRPLPIAYYILPEFFLIGFVVLFGWLAWYRPRKKKRDLEKQKESRLSAIREGKTASEVLKDK